MTISRLGTFERRQQGSVEIWTRSSTVAMALPPDRGGDAFPTALVKLGTVGTISVHPGNNDPTTWPRRRPAPPWRQSRQIHGVPRPFPAGSFRARHHTLSVPHAKGKPAEKSGLGRSAGLCPASPRIPSSGTGEAFPLPGSRLFCPRGSSSAAQPPGGGALQRLLPGDIQHLRSWQL